MQLIRVASNETFSYQIDNHILRTFPGIIFLFIFYAFTTSQRWVLIIFQGFAVKLNNCEDPEILKSLDKYGEAIGIYTYSLFEKKMEIIFLQ